MFVGAGDQFPTFYSTISVWLASFDGVAAISQIYAINPQDFLSLKSKSWIELLIEADTVGFCWSS